MLGRPRETWFETDLGSSTCHHRASTLLLLLIVVLYNDQIAENIIFVSKSE